MIKGLGVTIALELAKPTSTPEQPPASTADKMNLSDSHGRVAEIPTTPEAPTVSL